MDSNQLFILRDGQTSGPFSAAQLKQLAQNGSIGPNDHVGKTAQGPWHRADRVKGLGLSPPPIVFVPKNQHTTPIDAEVIAANQSPGPTIVVVPTQPSRTDSTRSVTEQDVWRGHPSQITNLRTFIWCAIATFFLLLFGIAASDTTSRAIILSCVLIPICVAAWRFIETKYTQYHVTTQRLRNSRGVIATTMDDLELYRVKDSRISQSLFERIFRLSTIELTTSDSSSTKIQIRSIPAATARNLREQIRMLVEELRDRKRVREVDVN